MILDNAWLQVPTVATMLLCRRYREKVKASIIFLFTEKPFLYSKVLYLSYIVATISI